MLNNFLWTFAKFKTRNFALFSVTLRREALGLNLVLSWARLEPRGWEGNTWSGLTTASCIPYSAGRPHLISSFPHELFAPRPSPEPVAGLQDSSFTLCWHHLWAVSLWPGPGTRGRHLGWTKTKAAAANLGWQLLTNSLSHLLQQGLLHKSEEINVNWNRNKMQSVHRNYHCKTFTKV